MKKLDLGQAITILANIGVIAGIVFLALELRQNNELLETEARRGLMLNRMDMNRAWAADENLMQLREKAFNGDPLTRAEQIRVEADLVSLLVGMEWEYEQFRSGRVLGVPVDGYRSIFTRFPYMKSLWPGVRRRFTAEFSRFMDEEVLAYEDASHD
jgi:hypothetical protein